jgi:hypothetical protein
MVNLSISFFGVLANPAILFAGRLSIAPHDRLSPHGGPRARLDPIVK